MNKLAYAAAAMFVASTPAYAGFLDFFSGGKSTVDRFAIEAKTGDYGKLNKTHKRGDTKIFMECDFTVSLICEYLTLPGDFDVRVRRVRTETDNRAMYVIGFHDRLLLPKKYSELPPYTWEELQNGISGKRTLPQIPDFSLKAVAN